MRPERLCLLDILEAADAIRAFVEGIGESDFVGDDLVRSAVLQKLTIIGEAAARLPRSFCERHPEVEWGDIVGFRNIAVHAYFAVEWPIVWVAATEDAPRLREWAARILAEESYPRRGVPGRGKSALTG
jgi:uncharacterized protein with HEPN domain